MSADELFDDERWTAILGIAGEAIEIPEAGAQRIYELAKERQLVSVVTGRDDGDDGDEVRAAGAVRRTAQSRNRGQRWQLIAGVAAALTLVVGVGGVLIQNRGRGDSSAKTASLTRTTTKETNAERAYQGGNGPSANPKAEPYSVGRSANLSSQLGYKSTFDKAGPAPTPAAARSKNFAVTSLDLTSLDVTKLQKNGAIDIELQTRSLTARYNDVQAIAKQNGGYLSDGKTNEVADTPTAAATIRVPVRNFDTALEQVAALAAKPANKVVSRTATSVDVTAQYADVGAQLKAATSARDQISLLLTKATNIGDILAVYERLNTSQTEVDRLQGQINLLGDQTAFSTIAVTLHETPTHAVDAGVKPKTGLAKAWADARHGFGNALAWIVARSGAALVVLVALVAMMLGLRYLYPVLRRALL